MSGAGLTPTVFLRNDRDGGAAMAFSEPEGFVTCRTAAKLGLAFAAIERALHRGLHVAGAFAYELGYALEPRLGRLMPAPMVPLIHVGLFARADRLSHDAAEAMVAQNAGVALPPVAMTVAERRPAYKAKIARILDYIAAGDVYQVNYTFPLRFAWAAGPWPLYARLAPRQRVAFGAVLDLPDLRAVSLSPELFFRKRGTRIEARPMKGTARRGRDAAEDAVLAADLAADPKNRAENLMIVDLIRNDLGRIARVGSVAVDALFVVEAYETLHQMTSTVSGEVVPGMAVLDVFRALFPCGSVTGAPKIRAMEIIAELEDAPRGVYTGAIGWIAPDRSMTFSVPIRTVALEGVNATMGIGSGIVADSDPDREYDECLLKADFLRRALG
ncbi:MAG: aminodeoxychorismate synthase component I [Alphaproteobacteria bacterium]